MKIFNKVVGIVVLLAMSISVSAQNVTVKGNVKDANGAPVIGATVLQVGTTSNGTVTDIDGNYVINVPANASLNFTSIGYIDQVVAVAGKGVINVVLDEDNEMLRPSTDLKHLLQPEMGYENGFCRPECTVCSEICPSGAILPVTREQKAATHIGRATVNLDLCISALGQDSCGNCSTRCPVGAIRMVNDPESGRKIPAVSEEICIGCGACEFLCPSRPISAITVNGLAVHHE